MDEERMTLPTLACKACDARKTCEGCPMAQHAMVGEIFSASFCAIFKLSYIDALLEGLLFKELYGLESSMRMLAAELKAKENPTNDAPVAV